MKKLIALALAAIALALLLAAPADAGENEKPRMNTALAKYIAQRIAEFDDIPADRKAQLEELAAYIRDHRSADRPVRLTFVCTHNSRRSHMAQLWAAAAAQRYAVNAISYSGGTESTAFNPRAVAAIGRAGFDVRAAFDDTNPVYIVSMGEGLPVQTCFSKVYDGAPNPKKGFGAVMVCHSADEACPYVEGAEARFAITYVDPKVSDATPEEAATYDERCAQIAREILFAFSLVNG